MRSTLLTCVVVAAVATQLVLAAPVPMRLKREFDKVPLCATLTFDALKVDVEDGIVEQAREGPKLVRKGDRLTLDDVDVSWDGFEVELEIKSPHTRGEGVGVYMYFDRSLRGPKKELVNLEDFWKAVHYFAVECASQDPGAGEPGR